MSIKILELGLINYNEAWDIQKKIQADIQNNLENDTLIFCQHPTVITIGKSGNAENLTRTAEFYKEKNIEVIYNNRGGDVTLHNPNQLVAYPIFNLNHFKPDLHWFLREIEECIINTIAHYGLIGERIDGLTGVWIDNARKVAAIGLHCSRWVTSHGLALNVSNDISEFEYIIPCGIREKAITSISKELGTTIDINEVKELLKNNFLEKFKK